MGARIFLIRGPAAILFMSRARDSCSEIASQNSFVLALMGASHDYRAIRSKMGSRTDVPV